MMTQKSKKFQRKYLGHRIQKGKKMVEVELVALHKAEHLPHINREAKQEVGLRVNLLAGLVVAAAQCQEVALVVALEVNRAVDLVPEANPVADLVLGANLVAVLVLEVNLGAGLVLGVNLAAGLVQEVNLGVGPDQGVALVVVRGQEVVHVVVLVPEVNLEADPVPEVNLVVVLALEVSLVADLAPEVNPGVDQDQGVVLEVALVPEAKWVAGLVVALAREVDLVAVPNQEADLEVEEVQRVVAAGRGLVHGLVVDRIVVLQGKKEKFYQIQVAQGLILDDGKRLNAKGKVVAVVVVMVGAVTPMTSLLNEAKNQLSAKRSPC